jgi:hypothetical protein
LSDYIHPEFGYFCPMPRFRRDLRLGFLAFGFGAGFGAVAVVALIAHNYEVHAITEPGITPTSLTGGAETVAETQVAIPNAPARISGGSEESQPIANRCEGPAKQPCREQKLRHVRTPITDNGPLIARVPVGRPAAFEPGNSGMVSAARPEPSEFPDASRLASARAEVNPPQGIENASGHRPQAAPVLRKNSRLAKQSRDEGTKRVAGVVPSLENVPQELGRAYARDSSRGRSVFWDWSR